MKHVSAANQQERHFLYAADGSITTGGTPQLVLARSMARCFFYFKNTSNGPLTLETDGPRATATLTSGVVTSIAITNAGFNMTKPPLVRFLGGGLAPAGYNQAPNSSYLGLNQPNGPAPSHIAAGLAVLSGNAVASVTITDGGSGYKIAPYVQLITSDLDPYGCAVPSATVGIQVAAGDTIQWDNSAVPTEAISVFGATTGQTFTARWMD